MAKATKGPAAIVDGAKRFVTGFGGFSAGQKAVVLAVIAGVLLGGIYFYRWAATPSYAPLFSNLSGTDASAITEKLTADGVKYELQDSGSTILVPQDAVNAERLAMAGEGLPADTGDSTTMLDDGGITGSEVVQNKKLQMALANELETTINSINGVESSVVNLAIPEKDVFLDEQSPTTASVLVKLKTGTTLSTDQVTSIVNLVAGGVPGLDPKNVSVVDGDGNTLSTDGGGNGANQEKTDGYNALQTAKLQTYLEGIYGKGNVSAIVSATLNFDEQSKTSIEYTQPQVIDPIAESGTSEKYSGSGSSASTGVLGPDNIQTENGTGTTGSGDGSYDKTSETKNNAINKIETNTKSAPGSVERQSVVVTLDAKAAGDADVNQVTQMVTQAAGIDAARGDTVSVVKTAFNTSAADSAKAELAAAEKADQQQQLINYGKTAALALLVLIMLIVVLLSFRRRKQETVDVLDVTAPPISLGDITDAAAEPRILESAARRPAVLLDPAPVDPALETAAARRDEVVQLVARQPEEVAELLRGWLADRRS